MSDSVDPVDELAVDDRCFASVGDHVTVGRAAVVVDHLLTIRFAARLVGRHTVERESHLVDVVSDDATVAAEHEDWHLDAPVGVLGRDVTGHDRVRAGLGATPVPMLMSFDIGMSPQLWSW